MGGSQAQQEPRQKLVLGDLEPWPACTAHRAQQRAAGPEDTPGGLGGTARGAAPSSWPHTVALALLHSPRPHGQTEGTMPEPVWLPTASCQDTYPQALGKQLRNSRGAWLGSLTCVVPADRQLSGPWPEGSVLCQPQRGRLPSVPQALQAIAPGLTQGGPGPSIWTCRLRAPQLLRTVPHNGGLSRLHTVRQCPAGLPGTHLEPGL